MGRQTADRTIRAARALAIACLALGCGGETPPLIDAGTEANDASADTDTDTDTDSDTDEARDAGPDDEPAASMTLVDFDGSSLPENGDGKGYPSPSGSGLALSQKESGAIAGKCLSARLTSGTFDISFNPYNTSENPRYPWPRGFARNYSAAPEGWRSNTYNRLSFWLKLPRTAPPHATDGSANMTVLTSVKRVKSPDMTSDTAGGGVYFHDLNVPATGTWVHVLLNAHPSSLQGEPAGDELGNVPHPTGEKSANFFDALTRFSIRTAVAHDPAELPADYLADEFVFIENPNQENDGQIHSLTATFVPNENRLIVTWMRRKDEDQVRHNVRYAFESVHHIGWEKAKDAPEPRVFPPGFNELAAMVYDSTELPLTNKREVYIAIKPENSSSFSEILVPLDLD